MLSYSFSTSFLIGTVAFGITYLLLPAVRRFALDREWVDLPDGQRKIHVQKMPRVGGLAIWFGLIGATLVMLITRSSSASNVVVEGLTERSLFLLMCGATVAVATGLLDDVYQLRAKHKLIGQVLAVVPVLFCPELTGAVATLFGGGSVATFFAYLLIAGWGVFMMNAMNLLDGMDGLAGGAALIGLFFIVLLGGLSGSMLLFSMALGGGLMAFLRYNLPPARVFMGDAGSLLLGYLMAMLALVSLSSNPTPSRAMALLVILALPLLDTGMAFARRLLRGRNPFDPDREHLHHRVLGRMFGNQARAVMVFYLLGIGQGLLALLMERWTTGAATVLFGIALLLGLLMIWELDYFNRDSYRRTETQKPMPAEPRRKRTHKGVYHAEGLLRGAVEHRPPVL